MCAMQSNDTGRTVFSCTLHRLIMAVMLMLTVTAAANPPSPIIHAYLLNIDKGNKMYTAFGHTALRMTCPEHGLDYCFTFEMDMHQSNYADVLLRKAKAGFAVVPTTKFLNEYSAEGRGVTESELNLTTRQKQEMWRLLDSEVKRGAAWTFDFIDNNCTTMVLYIIEKAIAPATIEFTKMPECMHGTRADVLDRISRESPWVRLALGAVLHGELSQPAHPMPMTAPEIIEEMLPTTVIVDSTKTRRMPLVTGCRTLLKNTVVAQPCPFKPWMAAVLTAVAAVTALGMMIRKRKKFNNNKNLSL